MAWPGTNSVSYTVNSSGVVTGLVAPDGTTIPLTPPAYSWAGLPAASSNTGLVVRITDFGSSAYSSYFVSDGTNWRPLNGITLLDQAAGSIAAPITTITGITAGLITGVQSGIPAGVILPGMDVRIEANILKSNANSTANVFAYLGTAGTTSDSVVYGGGLAAADGSGVRMDTRAVFSSTTSFTSDSWGANNGIGVGFMNDRTTNVNTAAAMTVSFGISGANALDIFKLINYRIWLEG